jgi:putative hemolysin
LEPPQAGDLTVLAELIVLVGALFTTFLITSYEATFAVLSRSTLEKLQENGVPRAHLILRIYEPRHRLRLMSRSGDALGVTALCTSLFFLLRHLPLPPRSTEIYALLGAVVLTLLVFILASITRRIRFEVEGEESRIPAIALAFVPLYFLLLPFTNLLELLSSGTYADEDYRAEKEEELRSIVEAEGETGVLEEGEKEMLQGVFGFHDRIVREVMIPRVDIKAVDSSATLGDLFKLISETGHSRVPVYEETLDSIRGIVYAKDLLQILVGRPELDLTTPLASFIVQQEQTKTDADSPFLRAPFFIYETKEIDDLLRDFRSNRTRLAIVLDEYAGTAGLVTTEDLVEEIVGEIQDEFDEEEQLFYWKEQDAVLISDARVNIEDLNEMLEVDLPNDGFETLGGYIYDHLGHIPTPGEEFTNGNLEIKILKVDGQRISEVELTRRPSEQVEEKAQ